jgi:homoserine dehydrogenase
VALNSFQTSGISPGSCRIGLLGFGGVGSALARRLTGPDPVPHLYLTHIADRRARDKRTSQPASLASLSWTDSFDDLLASDVDIIVEAVSGGQPASDYVRAALLAGKSVVTASRQVMAHQGPALLLLAERQGRQLRFGATVGGAMPIVRLLSDGLAGDRVTSIDAILNATSNAVLSSMQTTGCSPDEAIAEACASGYADADPLTDLDGSNAASKLAILCALAFHVRVSPAAIDTRTTAHVNREELSRAERRGGTIRQIAHAAYDRSSGALTAWVAPTFVPGASVFARARGPQNAAVVTCAYAGDITLSGPGAGGDASIVAMVSDLATIARDRAAIVPAPILVDPRVIAGLPEPSLAEAV